MSGLRQLGVFSVIMLAMLSSLGERVPTHAQTLAISAAPVAVPDVDGGNHHTCALTDAGTVTWWGGNIFGQLGDGTNVDSTTPVQVSGLGAGVVSISVGLYHSCAVTQGGTAKCWGHNEYGRLGDGTTISSNVPVDVVGLGSAVKQIAAGAWHTCAMLEAGSVKCWGLNVRGELGDGSYTSSGTPIDVNGLDTGVTAIAAGDDYTCALTVGGGLKCWGANDLGTLGNGTVAVSNVPVGVSGIDVGATHVAPGFLHACALVDGGAASCWGYNSAGQLGNGSIANSLVPVPLPSLTADVLAVSAGGYHSCAVLDTTGLKCWGDNLWGQLGDGTNENRAAPVGVIGLGSGVRLVDASRAHTCALLAEGTVRCWGWNGYGQLGHGTNADSNVPVEVLGLDLVVPPPLCQPGYFSQDGAEPCDPAPAGSYAPGDGAVEAIPCAAGSFASVEASVECAPAPVGFYVDTSGASTATQCPAGQTTDATGSDSIDDCHFPPSLPPTWTLAAKVSNSNTLQPKAPDYVPGTWSRSYVGVYIACTPSDSPIDVDRADHSVRFRDGVHMYSTKASDRCIDDDGDAAEPIVDFGPIMVDTKAPACDVSPSRLSVKRNQTADVSFVLSYSDATSGIDTVVPSYTATGGAVVNSTSGPDGSTFNVTMPNSTTGRVDARWTITDVAGNVSVCKGTIRAK